MESSRKIGINSLSVLSHHRAYRSVHGGFSIIHEQIDNKLRKTSTLPFEVRR